MLNKVLLDMKSYSQVFINLASDKADTRESIWEAEAVGNRADGSLTPSRLGNTIGISNGDSSNGSLGYSYGFVRITLPFWDMYNDIDGDVVIDILPNTEKEVAHPDARRDWNIAPYSIKKVGDTDKFVTVKYNFKGVTHIDANGKPTTPTATNYVGRCAGKYRREYETALPRHQTWTPINYPILRYVDVLLMIAEADNEVNGGPSELAYAAINAVRKRSIHVDSYKDIAGMSYGDFKQLIKAERVRELCFEGQRKLDLIRWDDYLTSMKHVYNLSIEDSRFPKNNRHAIAPARNATDRYRWLPIPTRELLSYI